MSRFKKLIDDLRARPDSTKVRQQLAYYNNVTEKDWRTLREQLIGEGNHDALLRLEARDQELRIRWTVNRPYQVNQHTYAREAYRVIPQGVDAESLGVAPDVIAVAVIARRDADKSRLQRIFTVTDDPTGAVRTDSIEAGQPTVAYVAPPARPWWQKIRL